MNDVSLMVLSGGLDDGTPPYILVEQDRVWRDMPAIRGGPGVNLETHRDALDHLLDVVMTKAVPLVQARQAMVASGMALYREIIPDFVHGLLTTAAERAGADPPILRIHVRKTYDWVPWELLHDGIDFLGLRFKIARVPIVVSPPDTSDVISHPVRRVRSLLAENVLRSDSNEEFDAWQRTFEGLIPPTVEEYRVPPEVASDWPTLQQLADAQMDDIFHVTCHGGLRNERGAVYWTLNIKDQIPLRSDVTPDFVKTLQFKTKPLVFGNACASVGSSPAARQDDERDTNGDRISQSRLRPGLATTFFSRGALNFVGTFAPITSALALDFARRFYERLLDREAPVPIAEALWATKRYYADRSMDDPSYLFYCLYGPPDTCFHPAGPSETEVAQMVVEA